MMERNDWTKEQITIALYEYCRKPFGQFSARKPFVQDLGKLMNRSAAAIVRKIGNLASFDPQMKERGVSGLSHTSHLDAEIWSKYYGHWDQLAIDAEKLIAEFKSNLPSGIELADYPELSITGNNPPREKINRTLFREMVLSAYDGQCCIIGIHNASLVDVCHIINSDKKEVLMDPCNGIALNPLFHRAYDNNLIGISPDYEVFVSEDIIGKRLNGMGERTKEYILSFNHQKIQMPRRFAPDQDLLAIHFELYKQRQAI